MNLPFCNRPSPQHGRKKVDDGALLLVAKNFRAVHPV